MSYGPEHWHCRIGRVRRGNVFAFPRTVSPDLGRDEQPVAECIDVLEDLLTDARSGRIRAIAAAVVERGDNATYCWARGYGQTAHAQAAAISDLSFAYAMDRHMTRRDRAER